MLFVCLLQQYVVIEERKTKECIDIMMMVVKFEQFHVLLGIFVTEWFGGHLVGK